jgi:hypothetical protein
MDRLAKHVQTLDKNRAGIPAKVEGLWFQTYASKKQDPISISKQGMVAQICNPSYARGIGKEAQGLGLGRGQKH